MYTLWPRVFAIKKEILDIKHHLQKLIGWTLVSRFHVRKWRTGARTQIRLFIKIHFYSESLHNSVWSPGSSWLTNSLPHITPPVLSYWINPYLILDDVIFNLDPIPVCKHRIPNVGIEVMAQRKTQNFNYLQWHSMFIILEIEWAFHVENTYKHSPIDLCMSKGYMRKQCLYGTTFVYKWYCWRRSGVGMYIQDWVQRWALKEVTPIPPLPTPPIPPYHIIEEFPIRIA